MKWSGPLKSGLNQSLNLISAGGKTGELIKRVADLSEIKVKSAIKRERNSQRLKIYVLAKLAVLLSLTRKCSILIYASFFSLNQKFDNFLYVHDTFYGMKKIKIKETGHKSRFFLLTSSRNGSQQHIFGEKQDFVNKERIFNLKRDYTRNGKH